MSEDIMLDQRTSMAKHTRFIGLSIVVFSVLAIFIEALD
jgi:hypothetical protein